MRWANRDAFLVSYPDDVKRVLLAYFLGNGLLTSDGDFWRRQRQLAQPAFHHKRIQAYAEVMVGHRVDAQDTLTLRPRHGLKMVVEARRTSIGEAPVMEQVAGV